MKTISDKIGEARQEKPYQLDSTILLNIDELDELQECVKKGIETMKFDLDDKKNEFHIIKQFYDAINDMSRKDDKVELKIR